MASSGLLFASESVTEGHPDKLCDRVADAILDACLAQDPDARVACDACTKTSMVMILGEITAKASVNYEQVVREAVKAVGYDNEEKGLDWRTMNVIVAVDEQSPELASAMLSNKAVEELGIYDQGIVFGYATNETPEMMPFSHGLASKLCAQLDRARKDGSLPWLKPSARVQVVVQHREEADGSLTPVRLHSVSIYTQQIVDMRPEQVQKGLFDHVVKPVVPDRLCDAATTYNLTQAKHPGAATAALSDTGLSGRAPLADGYGGWTSSGGPISGRDASRVHRAGAYGARWAARSLVEAGLCKRCEVQLSYTQGVAAPSSVFVNSYGTSRSAARNDAELADIVARSFDLRTGCLQRDLQLKSPAFQRLSAYGHFGRSDLDLTWERQRALK